MTGRPSDYSQELADLICEALAEGHSLRKICQSDDFPNKGTVFRWLATNKAFSDQYARAREAQADCLFDDILAIADDGANDSYTDDEGRTRTDFDVIARSKLRVDARKWMAGKLRPKVYGDKLQTEVSGGLTVKSAKELTDEELAAIAAGSSTGAAGPA